MISRPHWIAAFIGRALRQGHAADPDMIYETADDLYLEMCELDPEFAADSAFGARNHTGAARDLRSCD